MEKDQQTNIADQVREHLMVSAKPMDRDEFQRALDDLKDGTPVGPFVDRPAASVLLFRSVSRLSRYASGSQPVPPWLSMLFRYILLDLAMGRFRVIRGQALAARYGTRTPTVEGIHKAVLEQEKHRLIAEAQASVGRDIARSQLQEIEVLAEAMVKVKDRAALAERRADQAEAALANVRSMVVGLAAGRTWTGRTWTRPGPDRDRDLAEITDLIDQTRLDILRDRRPAAGT